MDFDANIDQLQYALWTIILASGPILGVALVVGLTIGVVQAATSINEATLSFVPKLALVLLVMALLSGFMLGVVSDFFVHILELVATIR